MKLLTKRKNRLDLKKALISLLFILLPGFVFSEDTSNQDAVKRGEYIFRATSGCSCHTVPGSSGQDLAGGRPLITPFGVIYSSNITPEQDTGIGTWSESDFINAMKKGVRPDGTHLFPVSPYTSFTQMKTDDLKDLKSYLDSVTPVQKKNKPDELRIPFKWRFGMFFWKLVNFREKSFEPTPEKSPEWNRGAYLVNALAHCGECHSPRDVSGGVRKNKLFSGSLEGPDGELVPNITPDLKTGIGSWEKDGMTRFLKSGQKPDGDYTEGLMTEVINEGYQYLSQEDLQVISEYIFSLKPIYKVLTKN